RGGAGRAARRRRAPGHGRAAASRRSPRRGGAAPPRGRRPHAPRARWRCARPSAAGRPQRGAPRQGRAERRRPSRPCRRRPVQPFAWKGQHAASLAPMSTTAVPPPGAPPAGDRAEAEIAALLQRSNQLGADRRVTNYAGGNTSCKVADVDPVTGAPLTLLAVKGSGGDLGTLRREGLAFLDADRLRLLDARWTPEADDDDMVRLVECCRCPDRPGAAPSIDTAMHGLLDAPHVDHLHPDAVIAFATAADGEALVRRCFGNEVGWVPWQRPGFALGRSIAALARLVRGLCSTDRRMVGHFCDDDAVLEFLSHEAATRLVPLGTSCPDHFLRTKVRPLLLDLPPGAPFEAQVERLRELHAQYRDDYAAYYARHATPDTPPMRGADPAIVLLPGIGMWSFGPDKQTARVAGEFYVNAINVMRGAEALSRYLPIDDAEKFGIEYWALEEAKLRRLPPPRRLAGRVALVTGAGSGIGLATARALAAEGAAIVAADLDAEAAARTAAELGGDDRAVALGADVSDENAVDAAVESACLAFGGVDLVVNNAGLSVSAPLTETTAEQWDLQYGVMARGSFLVSRAAARAMIAQGLGGDIVYVVSKNALVAGPDNVAYGSAKASQAHQVRLLAAELGRHGIRVNGVNPDGVVRGSGIFAGGWGARRAAIYGVPEEELGRYYASRTLLGIEVLPEHVAAAVL